MIRYRDDLRSQAENKQVTPLGGVYRVSIDGVTVYVGRTGDLYARQLQQRRNPLLRGGEFQVIERTNIYARQRIVEHQAIRHFGRGQPDGLPKFNRINGISDQNPLFNFYNSLGD